jgi:hypothetical protein
MLLTIVLIFVVALLGRAEAKEYVPCAFSTLRQPIDHFGGMKGSYAHRYSIDPEFFKPGGPILLFQGEEYALDCANDTIFYDWAREMKGLAVSLEHRYFGESLPFGNDSWTIANMRYLTLENIMQDAISFVQHLRDTIPGAAESKVIVGSGSYGAYIILPFRQVHPDTFFAAFATSGPTLGVVDSSDVRAYSHYSYTNRLYLDRSKLASERIQKGFDDIVARFQSGDYTGVQEDLGLCYTPTANDATLRKLTVPFYTALEFNYAIPRPGRGPGRALPFDTIIRWALNESITPLELINRAARLMFLKSVDEPTESQPCNDLNATHIVPSIQGQPFNYLGCTFGGLQSLDIPNETIFPAEITSDVRAAACRKAYNTSLMMSEEFNARYKTSPRDLLESKKILFSYGAFDPTTAAGVPEIPITAERCASRRLVTTGMAHREDMFRPQEGELQAVVDVSTQTAP